MGLHDVRFFLCPCVLSVETLKFDNQRVLEVFLGGGGHLLLYFDGSVWTGLGSPGSLSCTLRIF